jgi:hypothetical protein
MFLNGIVACENRWTLEGIEKGEETRPVRNSTYNNDSSSRFAKCKMTIAYTYLQTRHQIHDSDQPMRHTFVAGCAGPDRDRIRWADDTIADE